MREIWFIGMIKDKFLTEPNRELAIDIATAMHHAVSDEAAFGWFEHEGVTYYVHAHWKHGCINYDCNPATCYTDWELTSNADTE